jgi:hypothetical protein
VIAALAYKFPDEILPDQGIECFESLNPGFIQARNIPLKMSADGTR